MNESTIKCHNPECVAENPKNAKFCRVCGSPIITSGDEYTPDIFPDIELVPISIQPIRFVNGWEKASFVLLPLLIIFLIEICWDYKLEFIDEFRRDAWEITITIGMICLFIFIISVIVGLKKACLLAFFNSNADFIERKDFMGKLRRIAKNKKLGLFDGKKKKILLKSKYDAISKLDEQHVIVVENSKKGLYSITRRKLIIPINFDEIKSDKIGTFTAVKDMQMFHYDIYGKKLR